MKKATAAGTELLNEADQALYYAKTNGKNMVAVFSEKSGCKKPSNSVPTSYAANSRDQPRNG